MVLWNIYSDIEEFVCAWWVKPWARERARQEITANGYLCRNKGHDVRGASSGFSPYLQAFLLEDGKVVTKLSWGCATFYGLEKFLQQKGLAPLRSH